MVARQTPYRADSQHLLPRTDAAGAWVNAGPAPRTIAESGLPSTLLEDLTIKALRSRDRLKLVEIARMLCLHPQLCESILDDLVRRKLAVIDAADSMMRTHFKFALTDDGRAAADELVRRCAYVGPAPVSIDVYERVVRAQAEHRIRPTPEQVRAAVKHLVLPDWTIDAVGQAYASGRALMVYGPSGNGKTDIVVSVANCIEGTVLVPHALYAHGHIIEVYDARLHVPVLNSELDQADVDRRWREIKRPVAVVGGEMHSDALEMTYDAVRNVHVAPSSVRAQGGILVVDDLGRQRSSLSSILNRWIQLMENGFDSFALHSSEVITIPLDITLVFSTNLSLVDLMDEAYLRRIAYKIPIKSPAPREFHEIARRMAASVALPVDPAALEYLVHQLYSMPGVEAKSCYARDLIQTMTDYALYYGGQPQLDRPSVDRALRLYLAERTDSAPTG